MARHRSGSSVRDGAQAETGTLAGLRAAHMWNLSGTNGMTAFRMSRLLPLGLTVWLLASGCTTAESIEPAASESADTRSMWQATVLVETGGGHGSGVIIGAGSVLTAFHVVDDGVPKIEFFGGERESGVVGWASEELDLAIVRVGVPGRYPVPTMFCGELGMEQRVVVIGHPLAAHWVSVEGHLGTAEMPDLTPLLPLGFDLSLGNSGGPVFDDAGRVVGIASAILARAPSTKIAARSGLGGGQQTGPGLMLPASRFCGELRSL